MGRPRCEKMNPCEIETHHCWSRCVRRAFLMGPDPLTGKDHSHQRKMLYDLHEHLASIFAIDVGTVNLMNNHLHEHLRSRPDLVKKMNDEEVVWRYRKAWPRYDQGGRGWNYDPTDQELNRMLVRAGNEEGYIERLRRSLSDISFFMARVKEPLAKLANREEIPRVTGHYWCGRYGNRIIETPEEGIVSFLYCDLQQAKAETIIVPLGRDARILAPSAEWSFRQASLPHREFRRPAAAAKRTSRRRTATSLPRCRIPPMDDSLLGCLDGGRVVLACHQRRVCGATESNCAERRLAVCERYITGRLRGMAIVG